MGASRRRAQAAQAKARMVRLVVLGSLAALLALVLVVVAVGSGGDDEGGGPVDAAALFRDRCAACHGARGEGLSGPKLADGAVVARFPDVADQIELVEGGAPNMPPFGGVLSDDELRAVVEYTRAL